MADNILGYPNYISSSGGGGTTYVAGTGLQATLNGNGTYTLSASGPYITWYYEPGIANSKYIKAGNNVTLVYDASGGITLNAQVTGSGATSSGSYLVAVTEASLANSRVATQGNGITITDGGAGGNMTFGLSSSVTNSNLLTWSPGDTIFPNRRTLILGSGLSAGYGTNTLTLSVTGLTNGTVTSVDLAVPNIFSLSGNPITTAGTITIGLANQPSGLVWCGPASGSNAAPTFRQLTYLDMPLVAGANITFTPSGRNWIIASTASGGGGGSVSSVDVAVPASLLTSTGGPITTAGTITLGLASVSSGLFWSGPSSGSATTPTYRAIATTDLPNSIPATKIANGSVSDTEFQFLDGVTSGIQGQLDGKQPLDATLTALAAYNTNGIITQTATDTFTGRTITGTVNEVTVTNGNGVSGNPVVSLATGIDPAKLANGSVSATEFQFLDGVTSAIQTQLDGKAANSEAFVTLGNTSGLSNERRLEVAGGLTIQDGGANSAVTISGSALQPLDATLTALAAYNTTGFITQTAPDTFAGRTLAVAGGLTIQESGTVVTISASGVSGGGGGTTVYGVCNGRITLESGVAISTTNQAAKTTVYFTPFNGNQIGLYNGSSWTVSTFTERSASLSGLTADKPYDVFLYDNAGTLTLDLTAWTSSSARATALVLQDGILVKSGATSRRYLGTICITATAGQCEDSTKFRGVFNYYNQVPRSFLAVDTTDSWTYGSTTWRAFNNSSTLGVGQIVLVVGVEGNLSRFRAQGFGIPGTSNKMYVGVGVDSTTTNSAQINNPMGLDGGFSINNANFGVIAEYQGFLSIGRHTISPLESTSSTTAATFYGDNGDAKLQSGLIGFVEM